jgi:hypothetical protein
MVSDSTLLVVAMIAMMALMMGGLAFGGWRALIGRRRKPGRGSH